MGGGVGTLTVFISELSFWGFELLKNHGRVRVARSKNEKRPNKGQIFDEI